MRRFRVKKPRLFFIILTLLIAAGGVLAAALFFVSRQGAGYDVFRRVNVLVATSPVAIWSWDTKEDTFTVLTAPSEGVIEGVGGYGQYSLEALWKLGFIEGRGGTILTRSVEDVFGVPTPWYIGEEAGELPRASDAVSYGKHLFSYWSLPKFLLGGFRSNISIPSFISFVTALSRSRPDRIRPVDFGGASITVSQTLPDNSVRELIDPQRLDVVLAGLFEDELLRAEAVPVALYNTTAVPALGNRVARLLTTLGMLVVSVGNELPQIPTCQVRGKPEVLETKTAETIAVLLGCERTQSTESQRADLVVFLGTSMVDRYTKK